MLTAASSQSFLLLQNGIELIITFLILLQLLYLIFKVSRTKLSIIHASFLLVLLVHFVLLNAKRYFEIEGVNGFSFYVLYGPIIFLHAGFIQSKISVQNTLWISLGILASGLFLFLGFRDSQFSLFFLVGVLSGSLILVKNQKASYQKNWLAILCGYFIFLVGIYPLVHLLSSVDQFLLFKVPYSIIFIVFLIHNFSFFVGRTKFFKNLNSNQNVSLQSIDESLLGKITASLELDKVYLKKSLTLNELSIELQEPTYKVSKALKFKYKKSFPELINHYRINEAKKILEGSNGDFVKIEALGFDVGFNTPSAFYSAFKRETGLTPKDFHRKKTPINLQLT